MKHLCISLGHNSSAILIEDGKVLCGYEHERLTHIKSDSQFPFMAIRKCLENQRLTPDDIKCIYVSHWELLGDFTKMSAKHYEPDYLTRTFPNATVISLSKEFTHHDAHYWSAKAFAGKPFKYGIVADGFGTFGENLTIYKDDQVIFRSFGFGSSLGLLYQYATAYLGMTMNQDEYKLLGYESTIQDILSWEDYSILKDEIKKWSHKFFTEIIGYDSDVKFDPMCGLTALPEIRLDYVKRFDRVLKSLGIHKFDAPARVVIGHFVQSIVESVITKLVDKYKMPEVLLSGGLFYNVKLNNAIAKLDCVESICIFPLCGDQGAALGVYEYVNHDLVIEDFYWGHRDDVSGLPALYLDSKTDNVTKILFDLINDDKILNIVHGSMEFGPRALCNTSTIARPTKKNIDYINMLNSRSTIMPMAPVITDPYKFFDSKMIQKVWKSLEFMIITLDYVTLPVEYLGAAHRYPGKTMWSGRPQVLGKSHVLYGLVEKVGMLINTSLNLHGKPIIFSKGDIEFTFNTHRELDIENRVVNIIIQ